MTTEREQLKGAVESLLFITDRPLSLEELQGLVGAQEGVGEAVEELQRDYAGRPGPQILQVAGGWQMATRPEHGEFVRRLYKDRTTFRLSSAAMETLSIIAYRQPLTRAEIEEIRGVEVIAALETLLERRLIKVVGRKETLGRPLLYGTTPEFLRQFGLADLAELPELDQFLEQAAAPPSGEPAPETAAPSELPGSWSSAEGAPAPELLPVHPGEAYGPEGEAPAALGEGAAQDPPDGGSEAGDPGEAPASDEERGPAEG